ncbi:MAG: NRDE family protein [Gammaproteobacteria bacterium]
MCLIAFAIGGDPMEPVRLASNRDEQLDRPTAALHAWRLPSGIQVLAGRDLREGGTWLGLSEHGRVAMLTNVRSAQASAGDRSRGELVAGWLGSDQPLDAWLASVDVADYGGFNLVVGDWAGTDWHWVSNRDPQAPHTDHSTGVFLQRLVPGVYALSNASLDTPWPKTEQLRAAMTDPAMSTVTRVLADQSPVAPDMLPRTGVPAEIEAALASPFVRIPSRGYGTRSSLTLRIRRHADGDGGRLTASVQEWSHLAGDRHAWGAAPTVSTRWSLA